MTKFTIHDRNSAPAKSAELLAKAEAKYGFIPNLLGIASESPAALEGYVALSGLFSGSSLSPVEQQVVTLTVSFENGCDYCMAAHSMAAEMAGATAEQIAALREGAPLADARLEALRRFTAALVQNRGWLDEKEVEAFLAAGYSRQSILDVILGAALKTISNYTNHLTKTPLDAAFEKYRWTSPAKAAE